jgi:RNase H-fold protein (predicted Holliday junction resolvase)
MTSLLKLITAPSKVAHTLDWKKVGGATILNLEIHKDRIGMAIAVHPSFQESAHMLEPIPVSRSVTAEVKDRVEEIVKEHKVCAFVVSFPVQQDTGKYGAACGRVLYTLENLIKDSKIMTPNRPVCLWNNLPVQTQEVDEWGRNPLFARTSQKKIHLASEEQYQQDEAIVATEVWDDFVQAHWPEIYAQKQIYATQTSGFDSGSDNWDCEDDYIDERMHA